MLIYPMLRVKKLNFNASKSEFMAIGNAKQTKQLSFNTKCRANCEHLTFVHNMKCLRILIYEMRNKRDK